MSNDVGHHRPARPSRLNLVRGRCFPDKMTAVRSLSALRKPIVLLAAAAGLVALGSSVARVPGAAESARHELEAAKAAIEAGDEEAAGAAVARARESVDTVQVGVQGPVGLVGQWIPVVGTSVRDARHVADALGAVTSVDELAAEHSPESSRAA